MPILPADWSRILAVETPLLELLARSGLLYLGILALMRILPRRTGGEVAHMDLIFMLLIAQAAALSFGDYQSVTEAFIVILGLVAFDYVTNFLSFRLKWFERMVSHRPLPIIENGGKNAANLRREFITHDELLAHLRQQGFTDVEQVKLAMIEGNGKISFIAVNQNQ